VLSVQPGLTIWYDGTRLWWVQAGRAGHRVRGNETSAPGGTAPRPGSGLGSKLTWPAPGTAGQLDAAGRDGILIVFAQLSQAEMTFVWVVATLLTAQDPALADIIADYGAACSITRMIMSSQPG
jgi:hypothetical protein